MFVALALCTGLANAEPTTEPLGPILITGGRIAPAGFDQPLAVDRVEVTPKRRANLGVNLSEALSGVPGLVIQNRHNYAQDLQVSIRGFGSRAAFGVRGVRLISDGIPASGPDGQGQAAIFNLDTAERIEVLRGPFATAYGNHAGGVIRVTSREGSGPPRVDSGLTLGTHDTSRARLGAEGEHAGLGFVVDASRFETDGHRPHSAARRDQAFAKLTARPDPQTRLSLVAQALEQPETQDPLGLTWDAFHADPASTAPQATLFNTRKSIDHRQAGLVYEHEAGGQRLAVSGYAGQRSVVQYLSIPVAVQASPFSSGGVVDFSRDFHGLALRWSGERPIEAGRLQVNAGIEYEYSRDDRQGYENFDGPLLGVKGELRRDEIDRVTAFAPYLQVDWEWGPWLLSAGARHSRVRFEVEDRFVSGVNGDDSGSVDYARTTPSLGLRYSVSPSLNLYTSLAAGFETPTLNELSYATPSSGFNFDLAASRSMQAEVGIKALLGAGASLQMALFQIDTEDEIVVAESQGGRTSYRNAGETRRRGLELALEGTLTERLNARLALTALEAHYTTAFETRSGGAPVTVPAGNRLPGVPELSANLALTWEPRTGLQLGAEIDHRGKVFVEDLNQATPAPERTLVNLHLAADQQHGNWTFSQLLRVDNLFDTDHVGSVIVGSAGGRYYEPGPGRSWYAGISAAYRF